LAQQSANPVSWTGERHAVTFRCSAVQQVIEDWLLSGRFQVSRDLTTAKEDWT